MGPDKIENLDCRVSGQDVIHCFSHCVHCTTHPTMNNILPIENANANFLSLGIGLSKKRNEKRKQTPEPAIHARNPMKRSHLDNDSHASSSSVRSDDERGTYEDKVER